MKNGEKMREQEQESLKVNFFLAFDTNIKVSLRLALEFKHRMCGKASVFQGHREEFAPRSASCWHWNSNTGQGRVCPKVSLLLALEFKHRMCGKASVFQGHREEFATPVAGGSVIHNGVCTCLLCAAQFLHRPVSRWFWQ
jgi:hypothetical protein